ncbi:MAG: hypothetical protein OZ919_05335 [Xanthomonadaceae bacterium]|nr:hypothetical protein [Xanthomonadaceae bacterium]
MSINHIQFQPGLTLSEFSRLYVTDSLPRPRHSFTTHALHFAVESAREMSRWII